MTDVEHCFLLQLAHDHAFSVSKSGHCRVWNAGKLFQSYLSVNNWAGENLQPNGVDLYNLVLSTELVM